MTLTAKDSARIALQWRKIEARADLLRGRVEATPRAGMEGVLRAADQHINQTAAERMEAELMIALDMACVSYGILRAAA